MNQSLAQNIIEPGSEAWHADRLKGIGGSDAPAAVGECRWKTPLQLYLEKVGETEPEDESWEMLRGKCMEPALRQHFANTTKLEVRLPLTAIVHPKYDFMRYNPDGMCDGKVLAEFKTAAYGKGWGDEHTDEIPKEYIIQVQHGLACLGYEVAKCSVSIAGNKPRYYEVPANKELQEMIIEQEAEFWQRVIDRNAPEPTTNKDANRFHRAVNGDYIMADEAILLAVAGLRGVKAEIKAHDELKESLEVQIKNFMGANETLVDADGVQLITWKQQKGAKRIDAEALRDNYPDVAAAVTRQGDPLRRLLVK